MKNRTINLRNLPLNLGIRNKFFIDEGKKIYFGIKTLKLLVDTAVLAIMR